MKDCLIDCFDEIFDLNEPILSNRGMKLNFKYIIYEVLYFWFRFVCYCYCSQCGQGPPATAAWAMQAV